MKWAFGSRQTKQPKAMNQQTATNSKESKYFCKIFDETPWTHWQLPTVLPIHFCWQMVLPPSPLPLFLLNLIIWLSDYTGGKEKGYAWV